MKEKVLLIVSIAAMVASCQQAPTQQANTPKKEDQNFEQRRKDMQQQPANRCCEATQGVEKSSTVNETAGAPEVKVETKQ